jgi:hypothetical protein
MRVLKKALGRGVSCSRFVYDWLVKNDGFVVAVATIALVIITSLYLRETKKQRLLTQKAVALDIAPKVFIRNIHSTRKLAPEDKAVKIQTTFKLDNCGKTEAKNVTLRYTLSRLDKVFSGTKGPIEYVFPGQRPSYTTALFGVPLRDEQWESVAQALAAGERPVVSLPKAMPVVQLDVKLEYEDLEGNRIVTPYSFEYHWERNFWSGTAMGIK